MCERANTPTPASGGRPPRQLKFAILNTEPRVTGRHPDLLGGPGTWAHDVLGIMLADSGGGVVMPEWVEPVSAA